MPASQTTHSYGDIMSEEKAGTRYKKDNTQATVNAYTDILNIFAPGDLPNGLAVNIVENDVNAIYYKVDGTFDGVTWVAILAETGVAKAGNSQLLPSTEAKLKDPWYKIRVQIKPQVPDTQGNVTATITG